MAGALNVRGTVAEVSLTDCTLVPGLALTESGRPDASRPREPRLRRAGRSPRHRAGALHHRPVADPAEANHLIVSDGVVDAPPGPAQRVAIAADDTGSPGPESTLERVTVLGEVDVRELTLARDCILRRAAYAERRQAVWHGFCSLSLDGAHTPRRYRCQPDLVRAAAHGPAAADTETLRVRRHSPPPATASRPICSWPGAARARSARARRRRRDGSPIHQVLAPLPRDEPARAPRRVPPLRPRGRVLPRHMKEGRSDGCRRQPREVRPAADFAGVVLQQGRLLLDGDFNELVALLDRRLRAETCDLTRSARPDRCRRRLGAAPDARRLPHHGVRRPLYDRPRPHVRRRPAGREPRRRRRGIRPAALASRPARSTRRTTSSPTRSTPDATAARRADLLPTSTSGSARRTAVEDPSMSRPALGVDTAPRVETVWQVRLCLEHRQRDLRCDAEWSNYRPWPTRSAPSAGRLDDRADQPPAPADPCALAPVGGYRGLENRLYRVEVHDGGGPGRRPSSGRATTAPSRRGSSPRSSMPRRCRS